MYGDGSQAFMKGNYTMRDLLDIDNSMSKNCECFENFPLAYAYVPYQVFKTTYSVADGFNNGTIFPDLNKPLGVYGAEFNKGGTENE